MKMILHQLRQTFAKTNGFDELARFLVKAAAVLVLVGMLFRLPLFQWIGFALVIFLYIRLFSKNRSNVQQQNRAYLKYRNQVTFWFEKATRRVRLAMEKWKHRKTHRVYACPNCSQTVRIPKGKGTVAITCPRCTKKFVEKR